MNPSERKSPAMSIRSAFNCIAGSLRLQTLNERKKELAAEIDGIQKVAQELGQSYRTFSAN
jgi:hypothetical protein